MKLGGVMIAKVLKGYDTETLLISRTGDNPNVLERYSTEDDYESTFDRVSGRKCII